MVWSHVVNRIQYEIGRDKISSLLVSNQTKYQEFVSLFPEMIGLKLAENDHWGFPDDMDLLMAEHMSTRTDENTISS